MNSVPTFQHHHAAHCESGAMANMVSHYGMPLSEAMAFGLASGLSFAYLPFIRLHGQPLIAYRVLPKHIIKGLANALGMRFRFEIFRSPQAGQTRLDELLAAKQVVGLQTSVFWLPYFPPDMRFHFNAHNLLVYGRDGEDYLISDPVFEQPQRATAADLARARFAKGSLAPKGLLYYPEHINAPQVGRTITPQIVRTAVAKTARSMLAPVPVAGVRGIRRLAARVAQLDPAAPQSLELVGHIVRMQEEIGTGGGGFRFLYAAFLQDAAEQLPPLAAFAERLLGIGDGWRAFALAAARMIKGREPLDPTRLAQQLSRQADLEQAFFTDLKRVTQKP